MIFKPKIWGFYLIFVGSSCILWNLSCNLRFCWSKDTWNAIVRFSFKPCWNLWVWDGIVSRFISHFAYQVNLNGSSEIPEFESIETLDWALVTTPFFYVWCFWLIWDFCKFEHFCMDSNLVIWGWGIEFYVYRLN